MIVLLFSLFLAGIGGLVGYTLGMDFGYEKGLKDGINISVDVAKTVQGLKEAWGLDTRLHPTVDQEPTE